MPKLHIATIAALGLILALPQARGQDAAPTEAPTQAPARQQRAQSFTSPEEGFSALAEAIAEHDEARLLRILGPAARGLVQSGDRVADRAARDAFTAAYQQRHAIERPDAARATLAIGADTWPLPIPMTARGRVWRFDSRQGAQELVDRRVGRNELDTIATMRSLVAAQFEYASTAGRQGPWLAYARRFFSTPGQRDGLYWQSPADEAESPLGPLAAQASQGGYGRGDTPRPYHGYFFRILEAQGRSAPGGDQDYVVDGRMIGGFAVLAYPARHGSTGIQSFLVSHTGVVYQRDLGSRTREVAAGITAFDPDAGWSVVAP